MGIRGRMTTPQHLANFRSIKPQPRSDIKMMHLTQEFLTLKTLIRMYDEALSKGDPVILLELSVDIAESAEKLEQHSCDYANGH
jgi:hypothetical protein